MADDAKPTKVNQGDSMDLRLIPEFDGTSLAVVEWLEKVDLICKLRGITELHTVVTLRLTGGVFSVYEQLTNTNKNKYEKVKEALISAFLQTSFWHTSSSCPEGCVMASTWMYT